MSTLFTKIISGEIPCHKVYEDEHYLAFLDIRPVKRGHTLVIPKTEVDYIFDMEDSMLSGLLLVAKQVAAEIRAVVSCKRVGVMVAGLEVPHAHVHLIPIDSVSDLNFANAADVPTAELAELAAKISG